MTTKTYFLILILIILFGAVWRGLYFGQLPTGLYWDEQAMLMDARSVAELGTDVHGNSWMQPMFPSYGDFKLPVYIWLAALSVKIFGATAVAVRLPSLLVGLATIWFAAEAARLLLKKLARTNQITTQLLGLSVAAVIAISPWAIQFSRAGFEGHLAQFLVLASIWILLKTKKLAGIILAAVVGASATYTYFSVRFVWPVAAVMVLVIQWWQDRTSINQSVQKAAVLLLVFGLMLWPLFTSKYYEPSQQFRLSTDSILNTDYALESVFYRDLAGNTMLDRILFHRRVLMGQDLLQNIGSQISPTFLFVRGDANLRHGTAMFGLFLFPFIIPWALGLWRLYSLNRNLLWLALGWWLAALIPAVIPLEVPHALRSLNALFPLALIVGSGLEVMITWVWQQRTRMAAGLIGVWGAGVALYLAQFTGYYFNVYPAESAEHWQAGFDVAAEEVFHQAELADMVYIDPFDDRFYLWLWQQLPAAEVVSIEKTAFQSWQINNIRLGGLEWQKLAQQSNIVIVGPAEYIDQNVAEFELQPVAEQIITQTTPDLKLIRL